MSDMSDNASQDLKNGVVLRFFMSDKTVQHVSDACPTFRRYVVMTHLDLCSGIGGFSLAARWTERIETIGFCEIDPWCQRVLAKNFPGVPIHDDLRTLTGATVRDWLAKRIRGYGSETLAHSGSLRSTTTTEREQHPKEDHERQTDHALAASTVGRPRLDLITAGYPCQPFSHAGKRLGEADDRHLWPAIAALVFDLRPRWCLFENVAGHVSLGLDDVLSDLEALDYTCWPLVVPACAVNAPHRRDRVWLVAAHAESLRSSKGWGEIGAGTAFTQSPCGSEDVADAAEGGLRRGEPSGQPGFAACGGEVVSDTAQFSEREPANQANSVAIEWDAWQEPWGGGWWAVEPDVGRVAHGVPQRVDRLKGLGNAIVPQVAYVLLTAMVEADDA
jgi:DNA (cytosine-5)-methyltransferase 1